MIVKKEPGAGSLFPICTLEILVLHTKIKEQGANSRFRVPDSLFPINNFEISETFTQIRNKEPVPGSRFPILSTSQYSLYADK